MTGAHENGCHQGAQEVIAEDVSSLFCQKQMEKPRLMSLGALEAQKRCFLAPSNLAPRKFLVQLSASGSWHQDTLVDLYWKVKLHCFGAPAFDPSQYDKVPSLVLQRVAADQRQHTQRCSARIPHPTHWGGWFGQCIRKEELDLAPRRATHDENQ